MIIRSRSPVRISFGGGGTDIPPYCDQYGGCVVSATINKYSYATLETRNDNEIHIMTPEFINALKFSNMDELTSNRRMDLLTAVIKKMNESGLGLNIFMRSDIPSRSGLGGSAAAFAAMIGLFNHMKREKKMTDYEVAELAYNIEREELKVGGGKQDQYASVFGGINYIEFKNGWVRVNPLKMSSGHIMELEKNLVLVYTQPRKISGGKIQDVIQDQMRSFDKSKNIESDKSKIPEAFDQLKAVAEEIRYALLRGDFNHFGELLHEAWEAKKKSSPMSTTPYIDKLYDIAIQNGALGGKIAGAGGGGFMFFYCEPNKEHIVIEKLQEAGAMPITFTFDFKGLQSWEV